MIEPSSGRTTTSGPGAPLLGGLAATAALGIVFLIGFQLGSGQQRVQTVIVGPSGTAEASGGPGASPSGKAVGVPETAGDRIQKPRVDDELQQAYYSNLARGAWVVCGDSGRLQCQPIKPQPVDASRGFRPPETYVDGLPSVVLDPGLRTYLAGDVDDVFVGGVDGPPPHPWDRLLGVTLNGSIQFLDLGDLGPGRYVVMNRVFTQQGQFTLGISLTVKPFR